MARFRYRLALRVRPLIRLPPLSNRWCLRQPGFEVVGVVHAHIAPRSLSDLFLCPHAVPTPTSRGHKDVGNCRRINPEGVKCPLLVIILSLRTRVKRSTQFPNRDAAGTFSVPVGVSAYPSQPGNCTPSPLRNSTRWRSGTVAKISLRTTSGSSARLSIRSAHWPRSVPSTHFIHPPLPA